MGLLPLHSTTTKGPNKFWGCITNFNFVKPNTGSPQITVGGIAHICFKWFQITADAHPGVSWVSNDQKFCEKFKNTHCQVDHPAKIE